MRVVLFMRRPRRAVNFSVELIVEGIIEHLGSEFEPMRAESRFESNGFFRRLYNVVEAAFRQGDVNHVTGDVNFLTYMLNKRKTIVTVLDCGRISGAPDLRKRLIKLLWFSIPARHCAVITVISEDVKRQLLSHVRVDPKKIRVIPVCVPSVYRHVSKSFRTERPVILQVGTGPNKNLSRLFEALRGIPCTLEIVGKLTDHHRSLLARYEIEYRNHIDLSNQEMLERYANCDVVAFASTFEGFGMPIIEANLVGRPVVTGDVASMPEVAGNAACLVDPLSVSSIREGLLRVLRDAAYREQLIQNGFENAKRYDIRKITEQYEAVYREVKSSSERGAQGLRPVFGGRETQAVEEFFSNTSGDYADLFVARRTGRHFEFRQRLDVANEMSAQLHGSLLDCATGSGEITASLLEKGRFQRATAVDLSPRMLELSRRQIETHIRSQAPLELQMVNSNIFQFVVENSNRRFDLILCLGLIAHTGRLPELLTGLARMLQPDGAILLQATLSDHLGVRILRKLTERRHIRRQGYRISEFRRQDILQAAQNAGLQIAGQRRYGLGIPFGDRIWPRGNYYLEKTFQGWAKFHGAEEIYLLKLDGKPH